MSFIITLYTRDGIVMASDSRVTINSEQQTPDGKKLLLAAGMSDSNNKTFLFQDKIGISTFGQADIKGAPVSSFIEKFIREHESEDPSVSEFANDLNTHFRTFDPIPDVGFHVAGYDDTEYGLKQMVYQVAPLHDLVQIKNTDLPNGDPTQGAAWGGEGDILARLIQPVFSRDENGDYQQLPFFPIPWQFFTLQDAIDFAVYAIRTTIDSVRFLPRAKTVGGPIDVLVIKPSESIWISKKELTKN
ncbi:hypothetical protein PbJCM13498_15070 [Prolixibacter bellariivorans]|uniref:Uncharacterized protein n=1 Tax=Prolixibacter bellariivorans TaxID=314319 RepID=A0A5M4AY03_9BACT|nr:hypothetical protein [Prolixibacter bellariivorans]GET32644.1 hypothetical protein PbJCM13498_15070 [Prolixibacter bellariivorans]